LVKGRKRTTKTLVRTEEGAGDNTGEFGLFWGGGGGGGEEGRRLKRPVMDIKRVREEEVLNGWLSTEEGWLAERQGEGK